MKTICKLLFAFSLGLAIAGCAKYDDTELRGKVDNLTSEVNTLKANQQAMQAVIDVWKAGGYVASIDNSVPGQHTITFYGDQGKTVVIYDGEDGADGDAFFKDVTSDENGVTFVKQDDTKIFIPFAKAFKLVIENPEAEVEAGANVEFTYKVENANESTVVDVFAGGNYKAIVNATDKKIVVTAPAPAVDGSVLAWAQNEEGLFSMRKLSFTAKNEVEIKTKEEEYQAISGEAGTFVVEAVSNLDIKVETPAVDWVTVAVTKTDYKLTLTLTENTTGKPRETTINILRADNDMPVQSIKIVQLAAVEKVFTIERVWGKYSTAEASWNNYYGGAAGGERNVAIDENYVYIPETGTKKLWAISIADPTKVKAVDVSALVDEGTFAISCPRVIKNTDSNINGGKDVLVVSNMISGDPTLYFYVNGIDAAAKVVKANTWASRRLGDTFTYAGTLQEGVFFFKDFNSAEGTVTFPMKYTSKTENLYLSARLVAPAVNGAGAYFPFPDNMAKGVSSVRGGGVAQLVATEANFQTCAVAVTPTLTDLSGYYTDAAFRFFEFKDNRYIAYTRQVAGNDGRLFVIDGKKTDSWETILSTRHVIYHAAIQNETEGDKAPGDPSPKSSGNSGMDLDIHEANGAIYIAVVKQNVGLSVFKVYMKPVETVD